MTVVGRVDQTVILGRRVRRLARSSTSGAATVWVTSVKLVEIRRRFEVAIVQAAWGGSWRCSAPAAGDVISTIASSCM
jgi:hypothetical protein